MNEKKKKIKTLQLPFFNVINFVETIRKNDNQKVVAGVCIEGCEDVGCNAKCTATAAVNALPIDTLSISHIFVVVASVVLLCSCHVHDMQEVRSGHYVIFFQLLQKTQ